MRKKKNENHRQNRIGNSEKPHTHTHTYEYIYKHKLALCSHCMPIAMQKTTENVVTVATLYNIVVTFLLFNLHLLIYYSELCEFFNFFFLHSLSASVQVAIRVSSTTCWPLYLLFPLMFVMCSQVHFNQLFKKKRRRRRKTERKNENGTKKRRKCRKKRSSGERKSEVGDSTMNYSCEREREKLFFFLVMMKFNGGQCNWNKNEFSNHLLHQIE